jgi:hypothetical protein
MSAICNWALWMVALMAMAAPVSARKALDYQPA